MLSGLENPIHLLILLFLLLLLFGAKRLPEMGRSLGTGMREFKESITGRTATNEDQQPAATPELAPASATQADNASTAAHTPASS